MADADTLSQRMGLAMNEAAAREAFFAGALLAWVASGERTTRVTHQPTAASEWVIVAREGGWGLQGEGDTFVDAAKSLFDAGRKLSPDRFPDDDWG